VSDLQIFIAALFIAAAVLNSVARWLDVPYPIPLVIGGVLLGLIPGIPEIHLDPDLVLLLFLPPLLYSAAYFADLRALRRDLRVISLTSIGLVLMTTGIVAVVAHELIGLPWAVSFALGAIVSPTDPVAATAIMRGVGAPRRLVNVIEGESLVNDATALVTYRVAVAAAVGGSFSIVDAGLEFVGAAAGGIAIGLAVGYVVAEIRRRLNDTNTELTISLFTAYAAFIPADELGLSGVLASVTAGLYLGWRAPYISSPETRLQGYSMWSIITFLLNATLFILVGLQLPTVVDALGGYSVGEVAGYSAAICATVIGARFLWAFTTPYVIRVIDRRPAQVARRAPWQFRVVSSWAGMRGAVSLAAALALPLQTDAGTALPGRDLILFITFALIFVTVVGQGLTLPALIRRLGVQEDATEEENEELRARLVAARAALDRLDELEGEDWTRADTIERVRALYQFRQRRFKVRAGKIEDEEDGDGGIEARSLTYQRMMHEVYAAQRAALVGLRNEGRISSDVMRRVEREFDLEETRLEV
jgi:CPA1 family monovalent cation:H+ antiporter